MSVFKTYNILGILRSCFNRRGTAPRVPGDFCAAGPGPGGAHRQEQPYRHRRLHPPVYERPRTLRHGPTRRRQLCQVKGDSSEENSLIFCIFFIHSIKALKRGKKLPELMNH